MKKIIKYMDKKLFIASTMLFIFGLIMIFSASNVTAYMNGADPSRYFLKQTLFLIGSFLLCFLFMIMFKTSRYRKLSWVALLLVTGLVIVALVSGIVVNNTSGWLGIGDMGGQPSEFAKVIIIMWMACYYENMKTDKDKNNLLKAFIPVFVIGIISALILMQNDYGTATLFLLVAVFMFYLSPTSKKLKIFITMLGLFLVATIILLILTDSITLIPKEKLTRFDYTNPCEKYLNEGNQVCNGYIAINSGGIFGKGLGNSTQKYLHIPEEHTDFIFAILVEELGVVGAMSLLLFYLFILIRIVLIGKKATKTYQTFICYGVAFYLFIHITVNLGGVLGLIPLTGIVLPFISYGGSFALSICFALTLVQRINYETNLNKIQE